jgi:hypothetical protein
MPLSQFIKEQSAIVGLPVYLLVVIVAFSVAILFLSNITHESLTDQGYLRFSGDIHQLVSSASQIYSYADTQAVVTVDLDVPRSIQMLVLGGLPGTNTSILHNDATSANYFYLLTDGSIVVNHASVRFCGANETCWAQFSPGHYHVTLQMLTTTEGPYVAVIT